MTTDTTTATTLAGATEFAHMLLKVSDIDRSKRFYVDLCGFKVRPAKPLADGRPFADAAEFKKLLLAKPEPVVRGITAKLVTYATGQPVGFRDHRGMDQILAEAKSSDYGLRSLVHAVVASELFQKK